MNTCATCKSWREPKVFRDGFGACTCISESTSALAACVVSDGEWGRMCTRPDFGCTLWQARDGVLGNMMTDGRSSWPKEGE